MTPRRVIPGRSAAGAQGKGTRHGKTRAEHALAAASSRLVGGKGSACGAIYMPGPLPLRTLRVLRPGMTPWERIGP